MLNKGHVWLSEVTSGQANFIISFYREITLWSFKTNTSTYRNTWELQNEHWLCQTKAVALEHQNEHRVMPNKDHIGLELQNKHWVMPNQGHIGLELQNEHWVMPNQGHIWVELQNEHRVMPNEGHI